MIPVGPIIWGIIALGRLATNNGSGSAGGWSLGRKISAQVIAKFASWILFLVFAVSTKASLDDKAYGSALACGAMTFLLAAYQFPYFWIQKLAVSRGHVRLAYYLGRWLGVFWHYDDVVGASCLLAAHARSRLSGEQPKLDPWLEARIGRCMSRGGAWYAAVALFEAARGRAPWARSLLLNVTLMSPRFCAPAARRLALRWLLADAAERGDFRHVVYLAALTPVSDPWTRAVRDIAMLSAYPTSPRARFAGLWRLLSGDGKRLNAYRDAAKARTTESLGTGLRDEPGVTPTANAWSHTIREHLRILQGPSTLDRLKRVASQWNALFSQPATRAEIARRTLGLSAKRDPSEVLDEARAAIVGDFATALMGSRIPLGDVLRTEETCVLGDAVAAAREAYLLQLDTLLQDIEARGRADMPLPGQDEAAAAGLVFDVYLDACLLGGTDVRALVFGPTESVMCTHAVWLDQRYPRQSFIAHPIFRWLQAEARALDRTESIALQQRNCAATA